MSNLIKTNVCIIGAGPGGSTTSMFLAKAGISCVLVDKAKFPRDKICGDAFSGKVIDTLKELDTSIWEEFQKRDIQIGSSGVKFIAPNLKELKMPISNDISFNAGPLGFLSKRIDFDNFLIEQVRKFDSIHLLEGFEIVSYEKTQTGWILWSKNRKLEIHTKLLIIANGAQSYFARQIAKIGKDPSNYSAGVRTYYQGIANLNTDNLIELYFLKEVSPGYFWIMPLPNGFANVGVGMRSDIISAKKINLKKMIERIIQKYPTIKKRFVNAKIIDDIKGYGLPMGSKNRKISGDNFMIIGDAASLINPFTGEGIANAMISGMIASRQAIKCIKGDNYSKSFLSEYDIEVYKQMMPGFRISKRLQKMSKYPLFLNVMVNKANKNKLLRETLSHMFADIDVRRRIRNPIFYLRILFSGS